MSIRKLYNLRNIPRANGSTLNVFMFEVCLIFLAASVGLYAYRRITRFEYDFVPLNCRLFSVHCSCYFPQCLLSLRQHLRLLPLLHREVSYKLIAADESNFIT